MKIVVPNLDYYLKKGFKNFSKNESFLDQSKIGKKNREKRKLNFTQACDARDGLAKAAYRKIFDYLLLTLNAANEPDQHITTKHNEIGILDIFGFERVIEGKPILLLFGGSNSNGI